MLSAALECPLEKHFSSKDLKIFMGYKASKVTGGKISTINKINDTTRYGTFSTPNHSMLGSTSKTLRVGRLFMFRMNAGSIVSTKIPKIFV